MSKRYLPVAAVLACLSLASATAFATDDPPQSPPAGPPPAATQPTSAAPTAPAPTPTACVDTTRPRTTVVTSSRNAQRLHVLRGTAADKGCSSSSVALVSVSVALKHGTRCRYLARSARFSRKGTTCKKPRWLSAHGTATWSLRLPKRLAHGSYQVLTRAVDSAGNVERAHARRLAIRRTRSTNTK
jgi:hypothetical protein